MQYLLLSPLPPQPRYNPQGNICVSYPIKSRIRKDIEKDDQGHAATAIPRETKKRLGLFGLKKRRLKGAMIMCEQSEKRSVIHKTQC